MDMSKCPVGIVVPSQVSVWRGGIVLHSLSAAEMLHVSTL